MDYPGNLIVVAAPSGAGKSSLVKALLELDSHVHLSVSHTTRAPRGQEKHGRDYYFASQSEFDAMVEGNAFVEWAHVHNNRYGTSRAGIEAMIGQGSDVVLEIDYQGAMQIKKLFPAAATLFILPPSWEELQARLAGRHTDSPETQTRRLAAAMEEIAHWPAYQYTLWSSSREADLSQFRGLLAAERLRSRRLRELPGYNGQPLL